MRRSGATRRATAPAVQRWAARRRRRRRPDAAIARRPEHGSTLRPHRRAVVSTTGAAPCAGGREAKEPFVARRSDASGTRRRTSLRSSASPAARRGRSLRGDGAARSARLLGRARRRRPPTARCAPRVDLRHPGALRAVRARGARGGAGGLRAVLGDIASLREVWDDAARYRRRPRTTRRSLATLRRTSALTMDRRTRAGGTAPARALPATTRDDGHGG